MKKTLLILAAALLFLGCVPVPEKETAGKETGRDETMADYDFEEFNITQQEFPHPLQVAG